MGRQGAVDGRRRRRSSSDHSSSGSSSNDNRGTRRRNSSASRRINQARRLLLELERVTGGHLQLFYISATLAVVRFPLMTPSQRV